KIEQLKVLEQQKTEMLEKADMTTSLIEKVPRSILMAEIVNRMPERLTLTDLQLQSKRIAEPAATAKASPQSIAKAPTKGAKPPAPGTKKDGPADAPKPAKPPKIEYTLTIMGLAATDESVADFQAALKKCELLDRVEHVSSIASTVDSVSMRKFRIEAQLRTDADARKIDPLRVTRQSTQEGALAGVGTEGGPRVYDELDPTAPAPATLPDPMKPR
ncbi:MAG: PilN domain-containing protein, partial [Phycisphaerales bacterium]